MLEPSRKSQETSTVILTSSISTAHRSSVLLHKHVSMNLQIILCRSRLTYTVPNSTKSTWIFNHTILYHDFKKVIYMWHSWILNVNPKVSHTFSISYAYGLERPMEKANKVSLPTSKKSHRHAFEVFFMYIRHIALQVSELLLDVGKTN